jgi:hypothetical protein
MHVERTQEGSVQDLAAKARKAGCVPGYRESGTDGWRHQARRLADSETTLISFSECGADQEVMVVMPAYSWVRGVLGTFFLEPVAARPWEARLVLSATE